MSHPLQKTGSIDKWIDAPTRRVDVAGATFVYRKLGPATGVPVILLNHWGAVLDNFDPRIVDGLAATRPVIAVNYRGVGASDGKAPLTVAEMAEDAIAVIRALGFYEVDLIGFSLGGFVAHVFLSTMVHTIMARETCKAITVKLGLVGHHRSFFGDVGFYDRNNFAHGAASHVEAGHRAATLDDRQNDVLVRRVGQLRAMRSTALGMR